MKGVSETYHSCSGGYGVILAKLEKGNKMERVKPVLRILPIVVCLVVITVVVHELAHLIAAFVMGVPVDAFTWFDPTSISPAITFGPTDNQLGVVIVLFSGGLVTGALWLIICSTFFISKKYAERGLLWWLLGLFVAVLAFWQVGQGVLEGVLHQTYTSGAGKAGSFSFVIQCLFIILGLLIYLWPTHLWRDLLHKKSKVSD